MADGAVEEQFPKPIAAAEEVQVAPGQEASAPQPGAAQPDQSEEQKFSDILLCFFMHFRCLLPLSCSMGIFSLAVGKCSLVVPNYVILSLSGG